jgi:hypothetical protein
MESQTGQTVKGKSQREKVRLRSEAPSVKEKSHFEVKRQMIKEERDYEGKC